VHAQLQGASRIAVDDDGAPLIAPDLPFVAIPKSPPDWEDEDNLSFELSSGEPSFLLQWHRRRIRSVRRCLHG
jgi:hypothetical protein